MTTARLDPPLAVILSATLLFSLALWLRLIGTAWDGWAGLHPDERHLIYVTMDMLRGLDKAGDTSLGSLWFDPASPLNPRAEGRLYVYGELPVLVVTLFCRIMGITDWGGVMQTGRLFTAAVDASAVLAVFLLTQMLLRQNPQRHGTALLAAGLYAVAPTPMQLANFYTVDAWVAALSTWALVPMLALAQGGRSPWRAALMAGCLSGLALACKLPAVALGAPGLLAIWHLARHAGGRTAAAMLVLALLSALITFRLTDPFTFAGPGLFGLAPSPALLDDLREARSFANSPGMPPNLQWLAGYPLWALLPDLVLFGLGPAIAAGLLIAALTKAFRQMDPGALALLAVAAIAHAGLALVLGPWVLRYFAPLVGIAAVVAGVGLASAPRAVLAAGIALALFWGSGSVRLHSGAHPRLFATEWMRRLPEGTKIGFETDWDEGLPVLRYAPPGVEQVQPPGPYDYIPLRLPDTEDAGTATRLAAALDQAEYLSISSGRQIEVLPRLPDRFPVATRYYAALTAGELCFERVFYADRGFPLPGFAFDDRFAQEPWRVYDHPVVSIWQKQPCFDRARVEAILSGAG